ncbi:MAG: type II toxin-antitoxin system PemK/MazF family toxin [Desulfitobacteriaceae bacterium]
MGYTPSQGDIIWLNFSPQSGHEQKGKRPALVISNDFFNKRTDLSLVCPITSTKRDYPLHVEIHTCTKITGYIMVGQVKSVDCFSRYAEFIEKAPDELTQEVLSRLYACF